MASAPVPIEMNCPTCTRRLRVPAKAVGRSARCPRCREPFVVPRPEAPVVDQEVREVIGPLPARPKVFISHSQHDRDFVEGTIKPLLESHGVEAWWSQNIAGGAQWGQEVRRHLHEADWLLLAMSPHAAASEWVRQEVAWFLADRPHRLLPVMIHACQPGQFHSTLPNIQFIDFVTDAVEAGRKLIADMLRQFHKEAVEQRVKIDQLSEDNVRLREEAVHLDGQRAGQEDRLAQALQFDGNWTHKAPHDMPRFRPRKNGTASIIAVLNLKGGVGKSTLTANLAATLWGLQPRRKALLVDLDYQATLTASCLDRRTVERLRQQGRLVSTLLSADRPDARAVVLCSEPVPDDRERRTECALAAADEALMVAEVQVLMRWLTGQSLTDARFRLRAALHSPEVQAAHDFILLDCPPRLTTACVNALTACDYVLVPVLLDGRSTEGAPRLLRWMLDRRALLFPGLSGVGVVANKTRGKTRAALTNREVEDWDDLVQDCQTVWAGETQCRLDTYDTVVPMFTETAMARRFPASYPEMKPIFLNLVRELESHLAMPAGVMA